MNIPVNQQLVLSRRSDYLETVAEVDSGRKPIVWPSGTTVWFEFSDGSRWDGAVDEQSGRAVFDIDKSEVDSIPENTRYWVYISKPNDDHNVDMLLRYGSVVRRG